MNRKLKVALQCTLMATCLLENSIAMKREVNTESNESGKTTPSFSELEENSWLPSEVWDQIISAAVWIEPRYQSHWMEMVPHSIHNILLVCEDWHKKTISALEASTSLLGSPPFYPYNLTDDVLKKFPNLTTLNLNFNCKGITNEGFKHLTKLTTLRLDCTQETTNEALKAFTSLTKLRLTCSDDVTVEPIIYCTKLTNLYVHGTNITDRELVHLTNLTKLTLFETSSISDASLSQMKNLKTLKIQTPYYGLNGTPTITDESIMHLTNLTSFHLFDEGRISNEPIKKLTNLTNLVLGLAHNISNLCLEYSPNLTALNFFDGKISDKILMQTPNLKKLLLSTTKHITPSCLNSLKNLQHIIVNVQYLGKDSSGETELVEFNKILALPSLRTVEMTTCCASSVDCYDTILHLIEELIKYKENSEVEITNKFNNLKKMKNNISTIKKRNYSTPFASV
jgi:hypothetical protein